jgi:hypothetical protein
MDRLATMSVALSIRAGSHDLPTDPPALSLEPHAVELFAETWQEKLTLALTVVALVLVLQLMGVPI